MCLALFQNPKLELQNEDLLLPADWVELQITGDLLIPYEKGRKVMAINRRIKKSFPAILTNEKSEDGRLTIMTPEKDAHFFITHHDWEITPELKTNLFSLSTKETLREIRY